ncbi:unnamed protein product [Peronospora destructor]|uniref:Uncharacterized protein n=1 Tax=Peronospora destructor TaxID=86335 RepID=A0AAV0VI11_9STRA|nr:unnamed protein product [Peronospora destructor]
MGRFGPTSEDLPGGPGWDSGPGIVLTAAAGRVSFAAAVKDFGYPTGPDEPNGPNECIDPGVPNGPGEPNGLGERNGPGDRNPSADAGVEAIPDRSVVLVRTATRAWNEKPDDDLRPMIPLEEEALAAWMMGGIVLQSPPGFLVCTHPRATRVMMLDFFEEYLEGKVIAVVPPSVRMPQHIAEKTLLLQLLERRKGETVFDPMSRELVKAAKRTCDDLDTRRRTFVTFSSSR